MAVNYNKIAGIYDWCARFVFGKSIVNAQVYLLNAIPAGSGLLVVGGGTGWILEELAKLHKQALTITYIEASEKMMQFAKRRNTGNTTVVVFINELIESTELQEQYDIAITPFLFDNFTGPKALEIFEKIDGYLKPKGAWLYTDFQITSKKQVWQKLLLRTMYAFFKVAGIVTNDRLPDMEACFSSHSYKPILTKRFYKEFIVSTVYEKS